MGEIDFADRCTAALFAIATAIRDVTMPRYNTDAAAEEVTAARNAQLDKAKAHLVEARKALYQAQNIVKPRR
ncbi:hypothetical protein [Amycolatopsis sp.]|uniref:hypothetical protein n=1 Tax=Amycolatopsis sp. TaxID=37632 RepID=UPI002C856800|nr:hypothetical protein [Amycolatopsis sp.]HVV09220.1 hypothetical protein [Amycolatopsis sp.]